MRPQLVKQEIVDGDSLRVSWWGGIVVENCEESHSLGLWCSPRKRVRLLPNYARLRSLGSAGHTRRIE
jgi:hypothetical protein